MADSLRPHGLKHARLIFLQYPMEFVKFMSIELVMLSNHLILCHPLLLLPSIFPNIWVFANGSTFCIRWAKYWSFSFCPSVLAMNIQCQFPLGLTGLISLQPKGLSRVLQHYNSKASILWHSAFFIVHHIHTQLLEKP